MGTAHADATEGALMSIEKPENVGELIAKLATFDRSLKVQVGSEYEGFESPLTVTQEVVGPFPGQPREEYVYIQGEA